MNQELQTQAAALVETKSMSLLITCASFLIGTILAGTEVYRTGKNASSSANESPADLEAGGRKRESGADAQTGGGSSGDSTRRSFYKLIFLALLCRMIMLPVQAYYFSPAPGAERPMHISITTGMCTSSPACIVSRTLPDLAFASAFSLLVLFYAQLAGTASGGPRGGGGLGRLLTRSGTFRYCNIVMYSVYGAFLFFTGILPFISYTVFQSLIWSMLCVIYFILLSLLSYFGPVLYSLLKPSLARRSALAIRLVSMCVLCTVVFLRDTVCFGLAVCKSDVMYTRGVLPSFIGIVDGTVGGARWWSTFFARDAAGYILVELLPSLAILWMMHQRAPGSAAASASQRSANAGGGGGPVPSSSMSDLGRGTPPTPTSVGVGGVSSGRSGLRGGNGSSIKRSGSGLVVSRSSEAAALLDKGAGTGAYGTSDE